MASATADSSSIEANAGDARGKRPVWNVPANGAIEVGPVMGAVSWPALSEAAKASPKSLSSDSLKSLSDGPASAPPICHGSSVMPPSAKATHHTPINSSVKNPPLHAHQKSVNRRNGSGSNSTPTNESGGGPVMQQPAISMEGSETTPDKKVTTEPSPKGSRTGGGHGGNRRGNNSGPSHHNHGNRRDQDWNHQKDTHMQFPQHQRGGGGIRSYPRPPPPVASPFVGPPPPIRPPFGFPDIPPLYYVAPQPPPPESFRGMPFVPHPIPYAMFFPAMDPQRAQLLKQIEYYFSSDNLCKDVYLRQNMDHQGWVPISLIASFNRVKQYTNNIQYILETVKLSTLVEVQGEKIRRRNDWMNWLLHPLKPNYSLGPQSWGSNRPQFILTRSASGNLHNQFQVIENSVGDGSDYNRDGNGQLSGVVESDRSKTSRSLSRSDTL